MTRPPPGVNSRRRRSPAHTRLAVLSLVVLALACYVFWKPAAEPDGMRIDIYKSTRELVLRHADGTTRKFRVGLGPNPVGTKQREGDGATPEGEYFICVKNPNSRYSLSLGISYPGPGDAARGLASAAISEAEHAAILEAHNSGHTPPWKTALGGEIFIHGHGSRSDWTAGCIALEDVEMRELYDLVSIGTPVAIHP